MLGSGGARGYAHIGAVQVLKERGYQIAAIAGTSMGAVIGGLEAAGKLEEYVDWVSTLNARDVLKLMDASPFGAGAIRLERVLAHMTDILDGARIEELPIPYTAVATDLGARREVWFTSGPVDVAIRASVSIPGAITPIMVNGRLLVDGGLLNPVPMDPVISADADFTLAVSLSGWTPTNFAGPSRQSADAQPPNEWLDRFLKGAAGILENDLVASVLARFSRETPEPTPPPFDAAPAGLGIPQVTGLSLDTMSALITRFRLAAQPPDVLVTIPSTAARTMDFHRADELIEVGRRLTAAALDDAFGTGVPGVPGVPEVTGVPGPAGPPELEAVPRPEAG